jgi:hypothetical protein
MYRPVIQWLVLFAAGTAGIGHAQTWTHFSPPERDFRVIMPATPSHTTSGDGKCSSYTAGVNDRVLAVTRCPLDPAQSETNRRNAVIDRLADGDRCVNDQSDELGLAPGDHLFRVAGQYSAHRFVVQGNRVYELVVRVPSEDGPPRQLANDFFTSFQAGNGTYGIPALATRLTPESCASRGNALARRFCEHLICLVPLNQNHPVCAALPPIVRR